MPRRKRSTHRASRRSRRNDLSGVLFALSFLCVAVSFGALWAGYRFFRTEFPDVSVLRRGYVTVRYNGPKRPPTITIVKSRPPGWIGLAQVSTLAIDAIVVSEDWAFYQHKGYDPNQIKEAIETDWEEHRFARGASTITQQVARNVFLDKDKNLWRKLKELALAIELEKSVGKRKILETYLNVAEWGEGIFGISQASRHYFGKDPSQLTAKEGAFLAMLLPSPKRYSQSFRNHRLTAYARKTVDTILDKMAQAHYLTDEDRDRELLSRLPFESDGPVSPQPSTLPVDDVE